MAELWLGGAWGGGTYGMATEAEPFVERLKNWRNICGEITSGWPAGEYTGCAGPGPGPGTTTAGTGAGAGTGTGATLGLTAGRTTAGAGAGLAFGSGKTNAAGFTTALGAA